MTIGSAPERLAANQAVGHPQFVYAPAIFRSIAQFVDLVMIAAGGLFWYFALDRYNEYTYEYYGFCIVFVSFVTVLILRQVDLYEIDALMRPISRSDYLILALATAFLFFLSIAFALKSSEVYSRLWFLWFALTSFCLLLGGRVLLYYGLRSLSRSGLVGRNLAVLGGGDQGRMFLRRLNAVNPLFTAVIGVFDQSKGAIGEELEGHPILGDAEALIRLARERRIDDVVVALPWNADKTVIDTIEQLKELPINVYISSDLIGFQLSFKPAIGHTQALPMFEVVQRPISGWSYFLKASLDLVLASVLLVLLSPLLLLVALAIKLESPGPVFFLQPRFGFNNKTFMIYKFRSMYHRGVPEHRVKQATRDDPRVTRVGRIIRRTSIDELPQLFNVLNGTMSLVGPRPHVVSQNEDYARQIRGYFGRHKVKPGITGWAQVNGLRGETETLDKMESRVQHDIYYAENWSLLFDIRILIATVLVVLFQKNAY